MKTRNIFASLIVSSAFLAGIFASGDAATDSPVDIVQQLYQDYKPWNTKNKKPLDNPTELSQYFTTRTVALLMKDAACRKKTHDVCSLSVDPLTGQDDVGEGPPKLKFQIRGTPDTSATVAVDLGWGPGWPLLFCDLEKTPQGWRINDITNDEGSLTASIKSYFGTATAQ